MLDGRWYVSDDSVIKGFRERLTDSYVSYTADTVQKESPVTELTVVSEIETDLPVLTPKSEMISDVPYFDHDSDDVSTEIIVEVYWTEGGKVWHVSRECSALARSKNVCSGSVGDSHKDRKCKICG